MIYPDKKINLYLKIIFGILLFFFLVVIISEYKKIKKEFNQKQQAGSATQTSINNYENKYKRRTLGSPTWPE